MVEKAEGSGSCPIGKVSLAVAIAGLAVPLAAAVAIAAFLPQEEQDGIHYALCGLFILGMEFVAIVTGVLGRSDPCGKAGLITGSVCAALLLVSAVAWAFFSSQPTAPTGANATGTGEPRIPDPNGNARPGQ